MPGVVSKSGLLLACGVLNGGCWVTATCGLYMPDHSEFPIANDPFLGMRGHDRVEVIEGEQEYFAQLLAEPDSIEVWAEVYSDDPDVDYEVHDGLRLEEQGLEQIDRPCESGACFDWTYDQPRNSITLLGEGLPAGSLLHIEYDVLHGEDLMAAEPDR